MNLFPFKRNICFDDVESVSWWGGNKKGAGLRYIVKIPFYNFICKSYLERKNNKNLRYIKIVVVVVVIFFISSLPDIE